MAILNRYKDNLDDLTDSSDSKSPPGPIDERLRNVPRSRGCSIGLAEQNCLDKNVLVSDRSLQLAPKTGKF